MAGSLAEVVADCWTQTLADVPADGRPAGGDCTRRVLKDAAWSELTLWARPPARRSIPVATQRAGVGFRVAREMKR